MKSGLFESEILSETEMLSLKIRLFVCLTDVM